MEKDQTKVSIIIPVYNVERYLSDCLDSILDQSLYEIEIICVNDGSTDSSPMILQQYRRRDLRVVIVDFNMNKGQAYARNRGLETARGKYIYFVDADDMVKEGALEYLYNLMEAESLDGVLFSAETISEIRETVDLNYEMRYAAYPGTYTGTDIFSLLIDNSEYSHNVWRQFWRKEYLIQNHLFFHEKTSPHEDLLFTFRAIILAQSIRCINRACYICRKREGSIVTTKPNVKKLKAFIVCYGESLQFVQENQKLITNKLAAQLGSFFSLQKNYIVDTALYLCRNGFDISTLEVGNGFYRFVLNAFVFNRYLHIPEFLPTDILNRIKESKCIIVYGAGKVGHEVSDQLTRYGIVKFYVAETTKTIGVNERQVYSIDELLAYKEDSIVLVSVTSKYQDEMIRHLKKLGFQNYTVMCSKG